MKIDVDSLLYYLKVHRKHFEGFGIEIPNHEGILRFVDRGSNILAVGHIDTIGIPHNPRWDKKSNRVISPALDDRLGVWAIMEVLPKLGILPDVLLTDNEESMASTGHWFGRSQFKKSYNWIFELDRRGSDCVLYQYETYDWMNLIESYGFEVGVGSYSDICDMENIGSMAANFGIGYYDQHTTQCYTDLWQFESCIKRFANFYHHESEHLIPFEIEEKYSYFRDKEVYIPTGKLPGLSKLQNITYSVGADEGELPSDEIIGYCDYCGDDIRYEDIDIFLKNGLCRVCLNYEKGRFDYQDYFKR